MATKQKLTWAMGLIGALGVVGTMSCESSEDEFFLPPDGGGSGGKGGASGASGSSGAGSGGTAGESGGAAGAGGSAGGDGSADGGAAGGGAGEAGGGAGGSAGGSGGGDGGCDNPRKWCFDGDGDEHGIGSNSRMSCTKPGDDWVPDCDDCHDGNKLVHPGASACQGSAYTKTDGTTKSFDFDCDGEETQCGDSLKAIENGCQNAGLTCTGSGYLPNPDRQGTGQAFDRYCGSTLWRQCNSLAGICSSVNETRAAISCI